MGRQESDREDMLREATALVARVALRHVALTAAGFEEPVVVGFRRDGALSVFFGPDEAYQFNAAQELRRAYLDGLLYKAEQGRLVSLRRERQEREVALVRGELTAQEVASFCEQMEARLALLCQALETGCEIVGQVPPTGDVAARVQAWLARRPRPTVIAATPRAGG